MSDQSMPNAGSGKNNSKLAPGNIASPAEQTAAASRVADPRLPGCGAVPTPRSQRGDNRGIPAEPAGLGLSSGAVARLAARQDPATMRNNRRPASVIRPRSTSTKC
jgi:hypothetical protein